MAGEMCGADEKRCLARKFTELLKSPVVMADGSAWSGEAIVALLEEQGIETYVAGGAVRDIVRGETPKDIDLVAGAPIAVIGSILARTVGEQSLLIYNEPLGSLRIGASHDDYIDIGMFRDIASIADVRRLSDVRWAYGGDPLADALTTDFTVNALYWREVDGIVDPLGRGLEDCRAGILAIAADPRKVAVDLRLTLRLALFACRGLTPDEEAFAFFRRRIDTDILAFGAALPGYLDELTRGSRSLKQAVTQFAMHHGASVRSSCILTDAAAVEPAGYTSYWNNQGQANVSISLG